MLGADFRHWRRGGRNVCRGLRRFRPVSVRGALRLNVDTEIRANLNPYL